MLVNLVDVLVTLIIFALMFGQSSSCFSLSVMADEDNVKDILLTSPLMVSWYRAENPLDTEDKGDVGLSSENEAEGLDPEAEVAQKGQASGVGRPEGVTPTPVGEDEVLVKKWALRRVKQQVSSLLRGKDLPEVAEADEVAEVPYQLPTVERDATVCPVCERELPNHHKLMKHMGRSIHAANVARSWPHGTCYGLTSQLASKGSPSSVLTVGSVMQVGRV